LTSIYFQPVLTSWKREPEGELILDIINCIVDVIIIAGVKKSRSQIHEMVTGTFRDRLTSIKKKTIRLNRAVLEEVTSGDMEAIYVYPKDDFNSAIMEDANAQTPHEESTGRVLCTTDLGLRLYVKHPGTGEPEWTKTILLKAKVALPDAVKEMSEARARERRYVAVFLNARQKNY